MRGLLVLAALVAAPGVASAQYYQAPTYGYQAPKAPTYTAPSYGYQAPKTTYDYSSGNMYTTTPNYNGGANIQGSNLNNGSMWNTQVKPNGDMSGTDANGNYWNYNSSTKTYNNYGTGRMCTGTGASRICN